MGASMRPEDPADVWDRLVQQGKTPDEATAEVTRQFGPPPAPISTEQLESAGFIMDRKPAQLGRGVPGIASESTRSRLGSRPEPGYGMGVTRAAAAGASMGTSPYLIGAARGLSPDMTMGEGIDRETEGLDRFRTDHPGTALGVELAAAMMVPVPWTKLGALRSGVRGVQAARATSAGARLGARAVNAGGNIAAKGAIEGGITGAAEARGGLGARAAGATIGAGIGAVAPKALGYVGRAGGRVLGAMPGVSRAAAQGGLPILTPEERSAEMLIDAFTDDATAQAASTERRGIQGPHAPALVGAREVVREASEAGKPFTIMDAGGRNVMGVARGAQTRGGVAKEAIPDMLAARAGDTEQRVVSDLLNTTGGNRQDAFATADAIIARREAEAAPLYDALRAQFPAERPVKIEGLDALAGRPSFEAAIDEAERIIRESGGELSQPLRLKTKDGRTVIRPLSFDEAQLLKQAHDDVADMAGARAPIESGGTGKTRQAKQKGTHALLMDALDGKFDGYREARDAFAGPSAIHKAHNLGTEFHKTAPERVRQLTQDMSASERSAYRASALESFITNRVETIGETHDFSSRLTNNTRKKALMRELFDSEAHYNAFRELLGKEARMHASNRFMTQQSNTADKLMELSELFDVNLGDVASAAAGSPHAILRFGQAAGNRLANTYSRNVANDIGRMATLTGGEAVEVFETLAAQAAEIARKRATGAGARQRTGRQLGGRFGGAVAAQGEQP